MSDEPQDVGQDVAPQDVEALRQELARLRKINSALITRAQRGEAETDAFQLFQTAIALEARVADRTAALTAALDELRRANEGLVHARAAAEAAARARHEFLATMSHEIRTPMNGVMAALSLLEHTLLDEDQSELVGTMRFAADQLLRIVNDVLDFSRISDGRIGIRARAFPIDELVRGVGAVHQKDASAKGIMLEVHLDEAVPREVIGDPLRIRQVLSNLLDNAIKFTPDQGRVELLARVSRPDFVELTVADNGPGIEESELPRIFESFHQTDRSTTRAQGGTGLGLAIVKGLVEAMAGDVTVRSRVGEGTRFVVELPLPCAERQSHTVSPAPASSLPPTPSGLYVLVAEDHEINRRVLARILKKIGVEAEFVADGRACVERASQGGIDVVLMDWRMDVMDGIAATEEIRRLGLEDPRGKRMPIVAVTANALSEDRERCFRAGADAFVAKPFGLDDIVRALRDVLT